MSDLTEALEWWEDTDKEEYDPHIETGMAAARNWQALTEGRALIIERDDKGEWPIKLRGLLGSWAHRWPELSANDALDTLYDTIAVDALTVTAEPDGN